MNPNENYSQFKDTKYCYVPTCKNNSQKNKDKRFFMVPNSAKQHWCKAVGADCPKRNVYICEDHLNLKEDMQNYMYWTNMQVRPKLKPSLPQSLQHNLPVPTNEPQPSTSSFVPMDIEKDKLIKNVQCHKSVQVKPETAERTTCCSLPKSKITEKMSSSSSYYYDDCLNESIESDDAVPSTQESTTSADILEVPSQGPIPSKNFMLDIIEKRPQDYLGLPQNYYWLIIFLEFNLKLKSINIIITLYKIKNNLSFKQISDMFVVSLSSLWRMFYKTLYELSNFFKLLIFCPTPLDIKRICHPLFKINRDYSNIFCIIDCLEIEIEKPSNPIEQSLTWSQYKNANTLKYLLASTPDGFIVFVSAGFGGRISDTNIVEVSGFLDVLPSNCTVLVDRGFKHIDIILNKKGIKLHRPPSVVRNKKLSKKEAIQSKVIASLRIHIERVIRRVRLFKMLKPHSVMNNKLIQHTDEVITIACGLINLQNSIIKSE